MKIIYDVCIADSFVWVDMWPKASPDVEFKSIEIEFEPISEGNMKDADDALDSHIKAVYPNKEYKIYYWTWL